MITDHVAINFSILAFSKMIIIVAIAEEIQMPLAEELVESNSCNVRKINCHLCKNLLGIETLLSITLGSQLQ